MFTNWLTGTTSSSSSTSSSNNLLVEGNESQRESVLSSGSSSSMMLTTPPDVVLEVGPAPATSVRFVAHSLVLGMHSGYLRSAIRLDEHAAGGTRTSNGNGNGGCGNGTGNANGSSEIVLYLSNVTAEQFAPLLTYMYTGYLDLNVENIFAILLATHVLHMPRALEICRTFLARAQTEGYLTNNALNNLTVTAAAPTTTPAANNAANTVQGQGLASTISNTKIIRPIPSKATMINFGFLPLPPPPPPPPAPPQPLATVTTAAYKCLQQAYQQQQQQQQHQQQHVPQLLAEEQAEESEGEPYEDIDVVQPDESSNERRQSLLSLSLISTKTQMQRMLVVDEDGDANVDGVDDAEADVDRQPDADADDDDEDIEVFIDSNTETEDNDVPDIEMDYTTVSAVTTAGSGGSGSDASATATNRARANANEQHSKQPQKQHAVAGTHAYRQHMTKLNKNEVNHQQNSLRGRLRAASKIGSNSYKRRNSAMHKPDEVQRQQRSNNAATGGSGLQVAKAPIPASQLDAAAVEHAKVIIDVASCDGPVRFRRILNTAYGNKPDAHAAVGHQPTKQRTQQSLSYSFHQQMAKTINQQRLLQHANETENSGESSSGNGNHHQSHQQQHSALSGGCASGSGSGSGGQQQQKKTHGHDVYVCVYCKHTFKSQYCYQKHAKRHLNPLSLNASTAAAAAAAAAAEPPADELITSAGIKSNIAIANIQSKKQHRGSSGSGSGVGVGGTSYHHHQHHQTTGYGNALTLESTSASTAAAAAAAAAAITSAAGVMAKQSTSELMRREVRPLDMNVQYYPCKTCGSKFPSYYFVHKHRKLCHADEESSTASSSATTTTATTTIATTTIATTTNVVSTLTAADDELEMLAKFEGNAAVDGGKETTTTTTEEVEEEEEAKTIELKTSATAEAESSALGHEECVKTMLK